VRKNGKRNEIKSQHWAVRGSSFVVSFICSSVLPLVVQLRLNEGSGADFENQVQVQSSACQFGLCGTAEMKMLFHRHF
jgi:hypothetical protein